MIDARRTALFASGLQRSDALTGNAVAEAVRQTHREPGEFMPSWRYTEFVQANKVRME
jgi:hypothetical protein